MLKLHKIILIRNRSKKKQIQYMLRSGVGTFMQAFDQYSGKVLADLRFKDYGPLAKAISIGIALHVGQYFGFWNQLLALLTCVGLIAIAGSGLIMWWKRRPQGKLGAPALPKNFKMMKWVGVMIIALGILFPLVGVSLLFALVLDFLVIKRIPMVKQWVG